MAKLKRIKKDVEEFDDEELEELEDDNEGDNDEEQSGRFSNPFIKWGFGILAVVIIVFGGAYFKSSSSQKPVDNEPKTEQTDKDKETDKSKEKVEVPKETSKDDSVKPKGIDEKSATESLERADSPLPADETAKIRDALSESFSKVKSGAKNDINTGLTLTETGVFNLVHALVESGYAPDTASVKGYKSDSANVQQFTVNLTKEGAKSITLTGNWVPSLGQLGLVQIHGEIPDLGSPSDSKQYDPSVKNPEDNPKKSTDTSAKSTDSKGTSKTNN